MDNIKTTGNQTVYVVGNDEKVVLATYHGDQPACLTFNRENAQQLARGILQFLGEAPWPELQS